MKNNLIYVKEENKNDIKLINEKIYNLKKVISNIIIKIKNFSEQINDIALNNHILIIENEYIDSLKCNMIEMGYNEEEQMNKLNEIKKNNKILQETIKLGKKIFLLSFDELEEKVKNIIYYK